MQIGKLFPFIKMAEKGEDGPIILLFLLTVILSKSAAYSFARNAEASASSVISAKSCKD